MNCTGKKCIMQYGKVDPETCTAVTYCPEATPPKTNADKLRAMTDEELAMVLCGLLGCDDCPAEKLCHKGQLGLLIWLKKEVDE